MEIIQERTRLAAVMAVIIGAIVVGITVYRISDVPIAIAVAIIAAVIYCCAIGVIGGEMAGGMDDAISAASDAGFSFRYEWIWSALILQHYPIALAVMFSISLTHRNLAGVLMGVVAAILYFTMANAVQVGISRVVTRLLLRQRQLDDY